MKKMITICLLTGSMIACTKTEEVKTINWESKNTLVYDNIYELNTDSAVDATTTILFNESFYEDIRDAHATASFGTVNGKKSIGTLKEIKLSEVSISEFSFIESFYFDPSVDFSEIFDQAILTYNFDNQSIVLGVSNTLSVDCYPLEGVVFKLSQRDLSENIAKGELKLELRLNKDYEGVKNFDYKFILSYTAQLTHVLN